MLSGIVDFKTLIAKVFMIFFATISVLYTTVAFSDTDVPNIKKSPVLEIVTFKTSKKTSPQEVTIASKKVTKVLKSYNGFIKRTFSQDSTTPNQWIDIIEWQNIDDGISATKKIINNDDMKNFMSLMKNGYKMYHFDVKFEANESNSLSI